MLCLFREVEVHCLSSSCSVVIACAGFTYARSISYFREAELLPRNRVHDTVWMPLPILSWRVNLYYTSRSRTDRADSL